MTSEEVMTQLRKLSNPNKKDLEGMARFGINVENAWVISMPKLRKFGKEIKASFRHPEHTKDPCLDSSVRPQNDEEKIAASSFTKKTPRNDEGGENLHQLALQVWETGIHEARILAALIDVSSLVTEEQMERWAGDFDSWDVCDQVCMNLFDKTSFAYKKAKEWSEREEEFVKRAGFVLMASLASHDKKAGDGPFIEFLGIIKEKSDDPRNFVKKAVNWALRGIGKSRTKNLYKLSIKTAEEILENSSRLRSNNKIEEAKAARWVANGALNELKKEYIKKRFL